jgi:outer membrane biosynthesis protein TonB
MPRIVVRKGYRCKPGKRRELLAALQRVDEAGAAAGWPRGRYLFVESRAPGEPDLEVEFAFDSYAEMERLERRLREHLARSAREVAGAGQDLLIESSATRFLLLLDEPAGRPAAPPAPAARPSDERDAERIRERPTSPSAATSERPDAARAPQPRPAPSPPPPAPEPEPEPEPEPPLSLAERRARQLAAARAAMESAERTAGLPAERRASQRRAGETGPQGQDGDGASGPDPEP